MCLEEFLQAISVYRGEIRMPQFKVVNGKVSKEYNHFKEYSFVRCVATNTRLMGVVALHLAWRSKDDRKNELRQIIHLDFSEYGIDEYAEYFTDPNLEALNSMDSIEEFRETWKEVKIGLGGKQVNIPLAAAISLIEMSLETNTKYDSRHEEELRIFRADTRKRFALMKEAYIESPEYTDEYSDEDVTRMVSLEKLSVHETINYFIMRMVDRDYIAAKTLSTFSYDELQNTGISKNDIMTLTRNKVRKVKKHDAVSEIASTLQAKITTEYHCMSVCEEDYGDGYRYIKSKVSLESQRGMKESKVIGFEVYYDKPISDFEVAMLLRRTEYVTVFQITIPLDEFDLDYSVMAKDTLISQVPNGLLCTLYNKDNLHLNSRDYMLEGDVYGFYLITPKGELVIMSSEIVKISVMENDLIYGMLASNLELKGRYKFDNQVFKSFADLPGARFEDIIK